MKAHFARPALSAAEADALHELLQTCRAAAQALTVLSTRCELAPLQHFMRRRIRHYQAAAREVEALLIASAGLSRAQFDEMDAQHAVSVSLRGLHRFQRSLPAAVGTDALGAAGQSRLQHMLGAAERERYNVWLCQRLEGHALICLRDAFDATCLSTRTGTRIGGVSAQVVKRHLEMALLSGKRLRLLTLRIAYRCRRINTSARPEKDGTERHREDGPGTRLAPAAPAGRMEMMFSASSKPNKAVAARRAGIESPAEVRQAGATTSGSLHYCA